MLRFKFCFFLFPLLLLGCGQRQDGGQVAAPEVPSEVFQQRVIQQKVMQPPQGSDSDAKPNVKTSAKQILFGDLHVHTTFSPDAFITAMPAAGGMGLTPPAAACDFARYCSSLDFWSINDHAEGITPQRWADTKDIIRQCNAVAGDPANPDIVAFLGWEWSQVNIDRDQHYGHKNVIFRDTAENEVPTRSIAAPRQLLNKAPMGRVAQLMLGLSDFENRDYYLGIDTYYSEIAETPICPKDVNTRDLPADCLEVADTPGELFTKLNQWGFDSIVIPHGNAWGLNTPPATSFDKQLNAQQHDPRLQSLFEVYSGHGNSEEFRDWQSIGLSEDTGAYCPQPTDDYLPCCWQAGNIIAQRCEASGQEAIECSLRAAMARQNFVDAGISGHLTVPGQQVTDWLNCGQCSDCFAEPMDHRPKATAQYALAITNFDDPLKPLRYRFGFIGASDNHGAAPGTGYKEFNRQRFTDGLMLENPERAKSSMRDMREPKAESIPLHAVADVGLNKQRNMERQASFWMAGGLVAAHSEGRDRDSIWQALKSKNVYATSGDRTLLWFDEIGGEVAQPMGSELTLDRNPRFKVTAAGAFEQLPGCPQYAVDALGEQTLQQLCSGECYNPSDQRKAIDRIEVIRIRPQQSPDEDIASLIDDPWRQFSCEHDAPSCSVEFEDPDFVRSGREVIYYARAVQSPSDAINGTGLRCEVDDAGQCIAVNPCYGDSRTDLSSDCLAPLAERAWSSPIFIAHSEDEVFNLQ